MKLQSILLLMLTFCATSLVAQNINMSISGRITGQVDDREFGRLARVVNINGDSYKDLIIGAPGTNNNAGRLYRFLSPILGDTALTQSDMILKSSIANYRLGSNFLVADMDGDGHFDIIVASPFANNEHGEVRLFFGPFQAGNPKDILDANIVISGVQSESFGNSIHVAHGFSGTARPSLIVGASQADGNRGKAYVFREFSRTAPAQQSSENAQITFVGNEGLGLFGENALGLGDVNGDGHPDFLVSAPNVRSNGSNSGTIFLYFGPLVNGTYQDHQANVKILGRTQFTLWGGKLFAHDDMNSDGLAEFSIAATGDESGKVALFRGRAVWPDTIRVGQTPNAQHTHQLFATTGSFRGTGFSLDFTGDYDKDGIKDPVISSPFSSSNTGSYTVFTQNSAIRRTFNLTNPNADELFFGMHVANMGNVTLPEVDPYETDDLYVGVPGATSFAHSTRNGGIAYVYGGILTPPTVAMAFQPATIAQLTDSIEVITTITTGSRPIVTRRLIRTIIRTGLPTLRDTINVTDTVSPVRMWLKSKDDARWDLRFEVIDNLGALAFANGTLFFAARPLPFSLTSTFPETIRLEGNRRTEVQFLHEASVDTNGNQVRYQLYFGTQPNQFDNLSNLTLMQSTVDAAGFKLDYEALSNYLIVRGLLSPTTDYTIYWTVRAYNVKNNQALLNRFPTNAPATITLRRLGLEPYFTIPAQPRSIVLQGFSDALTTFSWSALASDNPNALVQYDFLLLADSSAASFAAPLHVKRVPQQMESQINFSMRFGQLDSILIARNLKDIARTDTARLFYSVRAIIDGQTNQPWFPKPKAARANVRFNVLIYVSNEEHPDAGLPKTFELKPNYPNPFNPSTQLRYAIPQAQQVSIEIYSITGQRVYQWQSGGMMPAGIHEHRINASAWASGVYIYRVKAGTWQGSGKMTLLK